MKNWLKTKIQQIKYSRAFLFIVGIIIGITYTYLTLEAPKWYKWATEGTKVVYAFTGDDLNKHEQESLVSAGDTPVKIDKEDKTSIESEEQMSSSSLIYLIKKYFPENWENMEKIMMCESSGETNRIGDKHLVDKNGKGMSYGLFQIRDIGDRIDDPKKLFNPETNIRMAREIYNQQGYSAWKICSYKFGII